jgi:hypothetical protein
LSISNATDYVILARSGELLIMIEGSGVLNGQSTKLGDVWSLEGDARFSGDAVFLQVVSPTSTD